MSKKIHTIQSSDKQEFDKEVNFFLELGGELYDGSYEVIKNDDGVVYSQVVTFDTNKCDVEFYNNGQIRCFVPLNKNGNKNGKYYYYHENGQIASVENYEDGKQVDKSISYHENGNISSQGQYVDGVLDGQVIHNRDDGKIEEESFHENGELMKVFQYYYWDNILQQILRYERTSMGGYPKLNGKSKFYYEDGSIKKEAIYRDGKLVEKKKWNEDGTIDRDEKQ